MAAESAPRRLTAWHWIVPVVILAVSTLAVWIGDLDRIVAARFYVPSDPTGWPVGYQQPWLFLYRWGVIPAIALGAAGLLVYAWGCLRTAHAARYVRRAGLLIIVSLALGPLLMVNGVLHETWGRPRPRQVTEFGGTQTFMPVLVPTFDPKAQSFPTGHGAASFAVLILYFVWRERRPALAWSALAAGLGLGSITCWARITQGGHWLSDGIWSGGVVYLSAWAMAVALETEPGDPTRPLHRRPILAALSMLGAVVLCVGYFTNFPLLERLDRDLEVPKGVKDLVLEVSGPPMEIHTRVAAGANAHVTVTWSGRSALMRRLEDAWEPTQGSPAMMNGRYSVFVKGYRTRQNLELWIAAPPTLRLTVRRLAQ